MDYDSRFPLPALTTGMTLKAWVNPSTITNNWRDVIYKFNDASTWKQPPTAVACPQAAVHSPRPV